MPAHPTCRSRASGAYQRGQLPSSEILISSLVSLKGGAAPSAWKSPVCGPLWADTMAMASRICSSDSSKRKDPGLPAMECGKELRRPMVAGRRGNYTQDCRDVPVGVGDAPAPLPRLWNTMTVAATFSWSYSRREEMDACFPSGRPAGRDGSETERLERTDGEPGSFPSMDSNLSETSHPAFAVRLERRGHSRSGRRQFT